MIHWYDHTFLPFEAQQSRGGGGSIGKAGRVPQVLYLHMRLSVPAIYIRSTEYSIVQ